MKKIGEYTAKGQLLSSDNGGERIQLFDGRFDTGYRVVEFIVRLADRDEPGIEVASAKLTTEPSTDNTVWNWQDNTEIAWASAGHDANGLSTQRPFGTIDPDNMIIEDLYISAYSYTSPELVNYMVKLEKYDITDWQGALGMVRNKSQA